MGEKKREEGVVFIEPGNVAAVHTPVEIVWREKRKHIWKSSLWES